MTIITQKEKTRDQQKLIQMPLSLHFFKCLLVLLLICFSGCKPAPVKTSPVKTPVTLEFSIWGGPAEKALYQQEITVFEALHPQIHIALLHIPDNYYQKLHLLAASDLLPDIVMINSQYLPVYASHGLFEDMSGFQLVGSETSKSPSESLSGIFYPNALKAMETPINTSGKPVLAAIPRDISNLVVYLNKEAFRRRHLSLPKANWTWADLLRIGKILTVDNDHDGRPEQYGLSFYKNPPLFWLPFVWSAGGDWLSPDGRRVTLNTKEAQEGLRFYQGLRHHFHIAPRQEESGSRLMSELFLNQTVAMMISGRWTVPVLREKATFDWDVLPLPRGSAGSKVGIDATGYAVSHASKHKEAAKLWVQFLSSRTVQEKLAQSGLLIPARQDVAESKAFLDPSHKPGEHARVFLDVISSGVPTRSHPRWNEMSEALNHGFEPVWNGEETVETGTERLIRQMQPWLEQP
ncbi:MAG: sugar ABC transporter substrate-binding protein [Cyanobacteria bacterium]|nr:sugar ABC transporter substrate-binding protein [Cyanobacteriota bacterium]